MPFLPDVRSIELATGVTLPVAQTGDPAGAPVLLLHGVTDSWRSFESVLPHLPDSIRAIAATQRGHGDASRPHAGYAFRDFASDAAALLDALEIPAAYVVGHSMGSGVAQRFAIDHPERTLGLMLVGSFHDMRTVPGVEELHAEVQRLGDPVDLAFVRAFQESTLARPIPAAFLDAMIAESAKLPARVWRAAFEAFRRDSLADDLALICARTSIVWGARDSLCSRAAQDALLAAIPESRIEVYADAGHAPHWEEPERFARDVAAFVSDRRLVVGGDRIHHAAQ